MSMTHLPGAPDKAVNAAAPSESDTRSLTTGRNAHVIGRSSTSERFGAEEIPGAPSHENLAADEARPPFSR
jgi:hypothetical protein